jgi:NADPH:quinone reductase-like Zn-dependent oxidoreductase
VALGATDGDIVLDLVRDTNYNLTCRSLNTARDGPSESEKRMEKMNAAVVTAFDEPPHYQEFEEPAPRSEDEVLVDVLAVGLHPRTRTGAAGRHYTSSGTLPMIPGIDGVGRRPDGKQLYFLAADDVIGTMADKAVVDVRRSIELPDDVDVAKVAATMNPAMSAWVALRCRVPIEPGQSVLVLGATGNAGTMAVAVAKRLAAGRVVGAGRDLDRLNALPAVGADAVVRLTDDAEKTAEALAAAAAEVDIVIDYLWGKPAQETIMALLTKRVDRSRALNWIQIGAVAGSTIELPSIALRSANLRIQGNGQGAVSTKTYLGELPSLVVEIENGTIGLEAVTFPLSDVEAVWARPDVPGRRTVLIP